MQLGSCQCSNSPVPSRLSSHYYGAAAINEMESGCHLLLLLTEIVGY